MGETPLKIVAAVVFACLQFMATVKLQGVLQQGGYKNRSLFKWLTKKGNLYLERLSLWVGMTVLCAGLTLACFAFGGVIWAQALSAIPFLLFAVFFVVADNKKALKIPLKRTARIKRLSVVYLLLLLCINYAFIALLGFIGKVVSNEFYSYVCYLPFAITPLFLPLILALANLIDGVYENGKNKKFVEKSAEKLAESKALKIAVVGSYGKTSQKSILKDILSVKYKVVATPESFNTPIGIAKTVAQEGFAEAEIFIAEMGARRLGDIKELCQLVQPTHAVFTGVCAQHIETFGCVENVLKAKCEVVQSGAGKIVCGADLKAKLLNAEFLSETEKEKCLFVELDKIVSEVEYHAEKTAFTLSLGEEKIRVETALLSASSVENIALAAVLAKEVGLTAAEIEEGIKKVLPIPHRLQLIKENGVYILDDGYNSNERGAKRAIEALCRFDGKKILVTPGLVETGVLDKELNGELGKEIALSKVDTCILVGETLVKAVKDGYLLAGGDEEKILLLPTLEKAQDWLKENLLEGDAVLFLNDLPDVY